MMTTFMTRRELARKLGVSDTALLSRLAQARLEPDAVALSGSLRPAIHLYLAERLSELRQIVANPTQIKS